MAPQGGGGSGGILGWLSRQFVNQLKAIPLLRWPRHGFFSPKTFATTLIDSDHRYVLAGVLCAGPGRCGLHRAEDIQGVDLGKA